MADHTARAVDSIFVNEKPPDYLLISVTVAIACSQFHIDLLTPELVLMMDKFNVEVAIFSLFCPPKPHLLPWHRDCLAIHQETEHLAMAGQSQNNLNK